MSSFVLFPLLSTAFHYVFMVLAITDAELKTVATAGSLIVGKLPTLFIQYKTTLKAGTKKKVLCLSSLQLTVIYLVAGLGIKYQISVCCCK